MQSSQQDDQEDHLEEGDEDVAGSEGQTDDSQHSADGSLDNGKTQSEETCGNLVIRRLVLHWHVVVADVRGVVHGEADTHDQVDQRHAVQVDPPPGHVAQHPGHDGHDGEGHPERAERVGDHDEGDQHHEACRD